MGLTIHWSFKSQVRSPDAARGLIDQLRQHALTLPFQRVGELVDQNLQDVHMLPTEFLFLRPDPVRAF